ncbi:MAG TPA: LysE family translocator [Streptosporangiaceae bacterium]|nr:LysE family translocator [Streptosporangiaceae bacterium]
MISITSAAGIALVALTMVLTPGPNMIYLVSRSLSQGWRAGLLSLLGTIAGFVIYMTVANLGLAGVFRTARWLYTGVTLAGAAYLLYLAWQALRPAGFTLFQPRELPRDPAARLLRMGLLTNLLNPKAAIMYLALIPQFLAPGRGHLIAQGFALGLIQITVSAAVNATIVVAAGGLAAFLARARVAGVAATRDRPSPGRGRDPSRPQ